MYLCSERMCMKGAYYGGKLVVAFVYLRLPNAKWNYACRSVLAARRSKLPVRYSCIDLRILECACYSGSRRFTYVYNRFVYEFAMCRAVKPKAFCIWIWCVRLIFWVGTTVWLYMEMWLVFVYNVRWTAHVNPKFRVNFFFFFLIGGSNSS